MIFFVLAFVLLLTGCNNKSGGDGNKNSELMDEVDKANKQVEKKVPDNLSQCAAEDFENIGKCDTLPQDKVCGYDHTVYEEGKEADHGLTYNNACFYCQLFGDDGEMNLGTTKVTALGYIAGECQ